MSYSDKLYPEVPTAPPDESHMYRLKKIDELEKFLRSEIEERGRLEKRCKKRATALTISDTSVITAITALEVTSLVCFSTGVGSPVGIAFCTGGIILGIAAGVLNKTQKVFISKAKKHDKIKVLAEAKLDSISRILSKAIEDAHIEHQEYEFILKEVQNYRLLKEQIRTKSKRVVDTITEEQREAILAQGREEGKQAFLRKIAATSGTPLAPAT